MEYRKDDSYALNIVDAEEIVTGGQTTKNNPLYVYETHSLSNDTYLVIRGHYKGESFFYKMALVNNDQHVLDILRNTEEDLFRWQMLKLLWLPIRIWIIPF